MAVKEFLVAIAVTLVVCTSASAAPHLRHHGHHKHKSDEGQSKIPAQKFIDTPTADIPEVFNGVEGTLILESDSQEEVDRTVKILREKDREDKKKGGPEVFIPIPLPTDFDSYDFNPKDGYISLDELSNVTGAQENAALAFNASDKNGDGKLTRGEFESAPWSLEGDKHLDADVDRVTASPKQNSINKRSLEEEELAPNEPESYDDPLEEEDTEL